MPTLADLLTPEAVEALKAAPTKTAPKPSQPSRRPGAPRTVATKGPAVVETVDPLLLQCQCARRHDGFRYVGDVLVHKACGSPRKDTPLLRGATVQPRTTQCAGGCGALVTVAKRKDALAEDLDKERLVVCIDCAQAMSAGSTITVMARPPHPNQSETSGAPAAVTISTTTKEKPLIDVSTLTDAELGAEVRKTMEAKAAEVVKPKHKKAKKAKDAKEAKVKAEKRADRKSLTDIGTLDGFTFKGVEVPALEVAMIPNVDITPTSKVRSPYNKCRSRNSEGTYPYKDEPGIGVKAVTWVDIINDHQRFAAMADQPGVTPEAKKPSKKGKVQIAAPIDLEERRVQALMTTCGVSEKKARKMLAALA